MELLKDKPQNITFDIGRYISDGIDLFKKNPGDIIIAFILASIFSIIPFFSLLAIGNFYKICRDVDTTGKADVGKIFNFDDFGAYFKFFILIFAVVCLSFIIVPMFLLPGALLRGNNGELSDVGASLLAGGFGIFFIAYFIFFLVLSIGLYYFIPLVALQKSYSVRANISTSWKLAKKDFFSILIFTIIVGFLSQLGILACGIGIIVTVPIGLCMRYKSFEKVINL